jgi:hypothetical protein
LLSFSTISVGVFLGAPIPCQGEALVRNTRPERAAECSVESSLLRLQRGLVVARAQLECGDMGRHKTAVSLIF